MKRMLGMLLALIVAFVGGIAVDRAVLDERAEPEATSTPGTTEPAGDLDRGSPDTASLRAAEAKVRSLGYCPTDQADLSDATLRFLIGEAFAGASGYYQQAFFFVDDRFVGTDAEEGSEGIEMTWRTDTIVALQYTLWNPDDGHCCPTGGTKVVRFEWDGNEVKRLDEMPPVSGETSAPARYGGFSPEDSELRESPCTY